MRGQDSIPWGNGPEARFHERATAYGWQATKRAWPDFVCFRPDGTAIAVEVKPRRGGRFQRLKVTQTRTMVWLSSLGAQCFVSDGENWERFDLQRHGHSLCQSGG